MNTNMKKRTSISTIAVVAVFLAVGCSRSGQNINRVQTALVDKSIFEGEWWVTETVVEADADARGITWTGAMAWSDLGLDKGASGTVSRIRWVIDEDFLFAYRAYELIEGGNIDGEDSDFRGQPIAAYEILDHVDVRKAYNSVTGESLNVTEENRTDNRWYERKSMRVDWAKNHLHSFFFASQLASMGGW